MYRRAHDVTSDNRAHSFLPITVCLMRWLSGIEESSHSLCAFPWKSECRRATCLEIWPILYFHDLDLFVAVQILDDTCRPVRSSAMNTDPLTSGSAANSHGWQNKGRNIYAKLETFVTIVVPGLSSSSSTSQESIAPTSTSSPASERSDEFAPGNWSWNPARDSQNSNDRLRNLPEWLEDFTENSENTKMVVPAHTFLMTQIRNAVRKWHQGSTVFYLRFPKHRNCDICLRTKITRTPCRRRTGEAVRRAAKCGDLITADHKVLNEGESRNNRQHAVVVQDDATQWNQSFLCKQPFQETEKSLRNFLEVSVKSKSNLCWQFIGIWQILWRITMESPNFNISSIRDERHCGRRRAQNKGRNFCRICCYLACISNGGLIQWNAIATCKIFKTSWKMGKFLIGSSENHSMLE